MKIVVVSFGIWTEIMDRLGSHLSRLGMRYETIHFNKIDPEDLSTIHIIPFIKNNMKIPKNFIIYQLDQYKEQFLYVKEYFDRAILILEYSTNNMDNYDAKTKKKLFYYPNSCNPDIVNFPQDFKYDITFYGRKTPRREKIISYLKNIYKINIIEGNKKDHIYNGLSKSRILINIKAEIDDDFKNTIEYPRINESLGYINVIISECLPYDKESEIFNLYDEIVCFTDLIKEDLSNIYDFVSKVEYYMNDENFENHLLLMKKNKQNLMKKIDSYSFEKFKKIGEFLDDNKEEIVLINNEKKFKLFTTISSPDDIPKKSCSLFIGSHRSSTNNIDLELYFREIEKSQDCKYSILIGKGDYDIENMDPSKIPDNIVSIYCNNYIHKNKIINFFPMGRDFRSIDEFKFSDPDNKDRNILCYCNFSLDTHRDREEIYDLIRDKDFITFKHMGKWLKYDVSREQFMRDLSNSKFVICPRGKAYDTFRFYDTLYSGSIPIVIRLPFHKYFEDLPILFLDSIESFSSLTEEYLEDEYKKLILKKRSYYRELDMDWWISKIKKNN